MAKVAEGTYRRANELGILTEYIAFIVLKDIIKSHGTIRRDAQSISDTAKKLNKSAPTLRRYLKVLIDYGFVTRNKYTYSFISHDRAWEILGADISFNKHKKRRGSFAVFKLRCSDMDSIKAEIEYREIVLKQKRQTWVIRDSIRRDKTKYSDSEIQRLEESDWCSLPEVLDEIYTERLGVLDEVEDSTMNSAKINWERKTMKDYGSKSYNKLTPFLTCDGIAKLLGYSSSHGAIIRKRVEGLGRCKWESRRVKVNTPKTHSEHRRTDRLVNLFPSKFYWDGISLWVTAVSLFYFT